MSRIISFNNIQASRWQDPYGPSHSFFISIPHVENGIPQHCSEADYHAVRVLANKPNALGEFKVAVPTLTDCNFGIQKLGIAPRWAWNTYLENREENDIKYRNYLNKEHKKYFLDFLKRCKLSEKFLPSELK